jgi:hypothetical protein
MSKHATGTLKVFSGKCCLCDVGIPVKARSTWGDPVEIHTGDIIILWRGGFIGTDVEQWTPDSELTVVVADHYQSYSDGSIELIKEPEAPFPMGIKDCGFDSPEWRIQVVKKFSDVIPGEHWPAYGFSYAYSEVADDARARGAS